MTKKLVSIVIPVYNGKDFIRNCLEGLFKNTVYPRYEVIVVDDASTDGSIEVLQEFEKQKKIRIVRNDENLGFAKTCNLGASVANGEYLVFLNMDTFPLSGWLSEMVSTLDKNKEIGACGGKWLYPGIDRVQHAGIVFASARNMILPEHIYRYAPSSLPAVNKEREFQAISCAASAVRKDVFFECNGFDERFLNSFEDIDLWLRIGEKGYKIYYCPKSVVIHHESVAKNRTIYDSRNERLFLEKWGAKIQADDYKYYIEDGYDIELIHKIEEEVGIDLVFLGVNKEDDLKVGKRNLSVSAFKEQILKNATLMVERFLKVRPGNNIFLARSFLSLANILSLQGKFKEAEEMLNKALSLSLSDKGLTVSICYTMGSNYERQRRLDEAIERFNYVINNESLSIKFKGGSHFHLGCIYKELGERKKAEHHFKECLEIIPDHKKARKLLNSSRLIEIE